MQRNDVFAFCCCCFCTTTESTTHRNSVRVHRTHVFRSVACRYGGASSIDSRRCVDFDSYCCVDAATRTVCIFTKFVHEPGVRKCRSLGAKLILYDVVDVFTRLAEANEIVEAKAFVDGFLVATAEHCKDIGHRSCFVWPHHHTNFENFRRESGRKVRILASIGMRLTQPSFEVMASFETIAKKHNMTFLWLDYDTLGAPSTGGSSVNWNQRFHHEFSSTADIAVIWLPGHNETFISRYWWHSVSNGAMQRHGVCRSAHCCFDNIEQQRE